MSHRSPGSKQAKAERRAARAAMRKKYGVKTDREATQIWLEDFRVKVRAACAKSKAKR